MKCPKCGNEWTPDSLVEGNSQRATVRMTGIAKKTVGRLAK
jgi:hypothetical protein